MKTVNSTDTKQDGPRYVASRMNAQGKTRWDPPTIETQTHGRATIRLKLSCVNPSGEIDLTELRELLVSAPAADGSFSINWLAHFTVGENESAQKHGRRPSWRPA